MDANRSNGESSTPKIVRDAFVPVEPLKVGDLPLHSLSLATCLLLEQIDSPLVGEDAGMKVKLYDLAAAAYILTRHVESAQAVLSQGRLYFDKAVYELANQIPAVELKALGVRLRQHLESAFATAIPAGPAGEKKTETAPPSPPSST